MITYDEPLNEYEELALRELLFLCELLAEEGDLERNLRMGDQQPREASNRREYSRTSYYRTRAAIEGDRRIKAAEIIPP